MAYATLDEFKLRMGDQLYAQLTDLDAATTTDDVVGQAVLDGAHGTLNAYISRRYAVPVDASNDTTLAQFLRKHVMNIAEFDLWQGHAMRRNMHERVREGYRETIKLLEMIAAGKADLPGASAIPGATATGPSAEATGHQRVFTEEAMEGL